VARANGGAVAVAAAVVVLALSNVACAGLGNGEWAATPPTTPDAPPQPAAPVVDGSTISGTGYRFTIPAGWQPAANAVVGEGGTVDLTIAGSSVTMGVRPVIDVMLETGTWKTVADYAAEHRDRLAGQAGITLQGASRPQTVAGSPAVAMEFTYRHQTRLRARQVLCLHHGRGYVITLHTYETASPEDLTAFDQSLGAWSWT